MNNKILIIGGSGFIGTYLIELIGKNYIVNYDKEQSSFFPEITKLGNVLDKDKLIDCFWKTELNSH